MTYHYNALSPKCMHKNNISHRLISVLSSSATLLAMCAAMRIIIS
jgi:hypothetical protein